MNAWYSIGLLVSGEGTIEDILWNGPADKVGLHPGQKIIGVNGQAYSGDLLKAAIKNATGKTEPIHLIVQSDTFLSTVELDYHDGPRFPVLERVNGTTDYLDDITKPLAQNPPLPAEAKLDE